MNPKKHLDYYSRIYPSAWKNVNKFRAGRGGDLPFWPEWCFLPLTGAYAIVSAEAESQGIDITSPDGMPLINDVGIIGALAAWRITQGVYRFDKDVYAAVIDTPLAGDLPHNILYNLPELCVFIETPGLTFLGQPLAGFFAYLEYDVPDGRKELRLVLDHTMPEHDTPRLISQVLHLGAWSLLESVERTMQEAERVSKDVLKAATSFQPGTAEYIQSGYMPLVSLLLYICSVNSEIGDGDRRPVRPKSKKTKKGQRMFPPPQATTWNVGVRMGASLRRAKEVSNTSDTPDATLDTAIKHRSSPRPHVRRAHWHGYWTGPRDGDQQFVLKWAPPILVGGEEDMPVTIRPVK